LHLERFEKFYRSFSLMEKNQKIKALEQMAKSYPRSAKQK
jgi:hypothetical protein